MEAPDRTSPLETLIEPSQRLFNLNIGELWRYRYLVRLLVRRNFIAQYKQSVLGPTWHILAPLLSTAVFTVVFGYIARIHTEGVPHVVFYLAGVVFWGFFSQCVQATSLTFIDNIQLFSKVYFPRLAVPVAAFFSKLITFLIQFALLLAVWAYYWWVTPEIRPNAALLLIPLLLLQSMLIALGLGLCVAAATVKYRDLSFLVAFFIQLWMYATPIVYPLSLVPEWLRPVMALNPVAPVIELFRYGFFGVGTPPWEAWGVSLGVTALLFVVGAMLFSRVERTFVDTV